MVHSLSSGILLILPQLQKNRTDCVSGCEVKDSQVPRLDMMLLLSMTLSSAAKTTATITAAGAAATPSSSSAVLGIALDSDAALRIRTRPETNKSCECSNFTIFARPVFWSSVRKQDEMQEIPGS